MIIVYPSLIVFIVLIFYSKVAKDIIGTKGLEYRCDENIKILI